MNDRERPHRGMRLSCLLTLAVLWSAAAWGAAADPLLQNCTPDQTGNSRKCVAPPPARQPRAAQRQPELISHREQSE
jgi:hypothetical protein